MPEMTSQTSLPSEHYERLGWKTFWVFVMERMNIALIIGLVACVFVILNLPYTGYAVWVFLIAFLITVFVSWIEYANYAYLLGPDALKVKRGVFHKEEVAVPYRQIQNVDIERPFLFLLAGTSRLVILTAGHDDANAAKEEGQADSEGIIPVIDKHLAARLQADLLSKANIQKVIQA